jgi:hypothetical protein
MSIIWWSEDDYEILRIYYERSDKKIILDLLPGKSWYAIQKKSEELGIKRKVANIGRPKKKRTGRSKYA